ncbi:MAG: hypothetical protein JMDDDDMK_05615 [Acidobacteria bacterium]|nr:hypothetical protein [Acidobacteriota bacterium]
MIGDSTMRNRWNVPSGIGNAISGADVFASAVNSIGAAVRRWFSKFRFNRNAA